MSNNILFTETAWEDYCYVKDIMILKKSGC